MKKNLFIIAALFMGMGAVNEVVATDNNVSTSSEVTAVNAYSDWEYDGTTTAYCKSLNGGGVTIGVKIKVYYNSDGDMGAKLTTDEDSMRPYPVRYSNLDKYDYMFTKGNKGYYFNY